MNSGRLRFLMVTAWVLCLAAGLDSPARAEYAGTELRPGLTLVAGDGGPCRIYRQQLGGDLSLEKEKNTLAKIVAEVNRDSLRLFDAGARLELADPGRGLAVISSGPRLDHLRFSLILGPEFPVGECGVIAVAARSAPAPPMEVDLRIDGRPFKTDGWYDRHIRSGEVKARQLVMAGPLEREAELISSLEKGRAMTVTGGRPVTLSFDLTGLGEALDLLRQKRDEIDRAMEGEIRNYKKRLEVLNQFGSGRIVK